MSGTLLPRLLSPLLALEGRPEAHHEGKMIQHVLIGQHLVWWAGVVSILAGAVVVDGGLQRPQLLIGAGPGCHHGSTSGSLSRALGSPSGSTMPHMPTPHVPLATRFWKRVAFTSEGCW